MEAELVLDAQAVLAESPLWVAEENALYWADIKAPTLHRWRPNTGLDRSWTLPAQIGAYALDGTGRALVALRTGLHWLDLATGTTDLAAPPPFDPKLIRFNDGACDSRGRFWIGTITEPVDGAASQAAGALYSFTTAGGLLPHAEFSLITNGLAWSPDERDIYVSDSAAATIYRYGFDRDAGSLRGKTVFARLDEPPGVPDGAAVDEQGGYWCAVHGGGCLHRYRLDGVLDLVVKLPVSQPTMCCFGGSDLRTIYVTSAKEGLDQAALAKQPGAGGLFRLQAPVAGLRKPWKVL